MFLDAKTYSVWTAPYGVFTTDVTVNASHLFWMGNVMRRRTELWVHCITPLPVLVEKVDNFQLFKHQRRRQPIRSPYANTLVQTPSQSCSCNAGKVMWLAVVTVTIVSVPSFRHALRQASMLRPVWIYCYSQSKSWSVHDKLESCKWSSKANTIFFILYSSNDKTVLLVLWGNTLVGLFLWLLLTYIVICKLRFCVMHNGDCKICIFGMGVE